MAFEIKRLGRQKIQYDSANLDHFLLAQLVVDGVKETPTAATITIYRRGSSTALVTDDDMVISGTLATYAVDTTTEASWPIETGYRAEVSFESAETNIRALVFDVVRWLLDLSIGVDQLVSIDDRVDGMSHTTYDDLAPLIVACRDVLQIQIEHKVLKDQKLVENMILDSGAVAICARYHILAQLFMNRGNMEVYAEYMKQYNDLLAMVLSLIKYDVGQDGDEDADLGGIQRARLVT